jgi:hypothetical protein
MRTVLRNIKGISGAVEQSRRVIADDTIVFVTLVAVECRETLECAMAARAMAGSISGLMPFDSAGCVNDPGFHSPTPL